MNPTHVSIQKRDWKLKSRGAGDEPPVLNPVLRFSFCFIYHVKPLIAELAYLLELPNKPGPTQREFEIKKEASYIISVKNPDIQVPGFAAFSAPKNKPQYPKHLKEMFGDSLKNKRKTAR